jgi:uncharacterized protein YbjQ (UPF0145 family)
MPTAKLLNRYAVVLGATFLLGACSTWSHSEVRPTTSAGEGQAISQSESQSAALPAPAEAVVKTDPAAVIVTKEDITDRTYESLGDIKVTVNKTTLFHPDPTPALVDVELKEEAAKLGADAVVLVRYGTVGVSLFSWGSLDGQGRAVKFVK